MSLSYASKKVKDMTKTLKLLQNFGRKMNHTELRALRKKAKLTQQACWEIVGRTSGRQYKNWESGKAPIPFAESQLLCIGLVFFKHLAVADVQAFMPETLRLAIFPA